jgi:hypothetical protein
MATPEQWAQQEEYAAKVEDCDSCCIVELRARVEALEANSKPTPNPSQIGSSLVERVQDAIHDLEFPHGDDEARAAIREVLAYLCEHELIGNYARQQLEQEVGF